MAALAAGVDGAAHRSSATFVVAYTGLMWVLTALYASAWLRLPDGLLTIIVLGESVVVTVAGPDTRGSVTAALVALVGSVIAATIEMTVAATPPAPDGE